MNDPAGKLHTPPSETPDLGDISGLITPDGPDRRTRQQRMVAGDWFWGAEVSYIRPPSAYPNPVPALI